MDKRPTLTAAAITACAVMAAILIVVVPAMAGDLADAKSTKKIHFTKTLTSSHDPGAGHGGHQIAMLLLPQRGVIYDGSLTYTADRPLQIAVLHEIDPADSAGQPVWTVDGSTVYGLSLIGGQDSSGSLEFTGAALALHSTDPDPFVATASVDGWTRGGAVGWYVNQTISVRQEPPSVDLFRTGVPAVIPLHRGIYEGNQTLYIITDSSDGPLADRISQRKAGWNVTHAPALAAIAGPVPGRVYFFTDGVYGPGLYGFQDDVLSSIPGQDDGYSALRRAAHVSWKPGQNAQTLDSVEDIMRAERGGRIKVEETGAVLNTPQIVWPGGQMQVHAGGDDGAGSRATAAAAAAAAGEAGSGGQVLDIDRVEGTVTFVAHRGWGPDGQTVYHIITDATPEGPARMMGVPHAPASARLAPDPAVMDLYQFKNGLAGSGALGFQPAVAAAKPGDHGYAPVWRIINVEWNSADQALLLETVGDIDAAREDGLVTVSTARPLNHDHIVNRPSVDPFQ